MSDSKQSALHQKNRSLFRAGILVGVLWLLLFFAVYVGHINVLHYSSRCIFYDRYGFYCISCGGTRALYYFLKGDFIKSFFYHPIVLYGAGFYVLFMGSYLAEWATKGKVKCVGHVEFFLVTGMILAIVNCIVKNFM